MLADEAHARNYIFAQLPPAFNDDPIEADVGDVVVPQLSGNDTFRSTTANIIGTDYIVQAVMANPFVDGRWFAYPEMYDQATGADWKGEMIQVFSGEVVHLDVLAAERFDPNVSSHPDVFAITIAVRDQGYFKQTQHEGPRAMGWDATARLQFEWDGAPGVSCASLSGVFVHVLVKDAPGAIFPWFWPGNSQSVIAQNVTWDTNRANTVYQPDGSDPICNWSTSIFELPTGGAFEFNAR